MDVFGRGNIVWLKTRVIHTQQYLSKRVLYGRRNGRDAWSKAFVFYSSRTQNK